MDNTSRRSQYSYAPEGSVLAPSRTRRNKGECFHEGLLLRRAGKLIKACSIAIEFVVVSAGAGRLLGSTSILPLSFRADRR